MLACESCHSAAASPDFLGGSRTFRLFLHAAARATSDGREASSPSPPVLHGSQAVSAGCTSATAPAGVPVAYAYGGGRPLGVPNSCVSLGIASGLRGGMIGAGFGAVFAFSSASGSSGAVLAHVGQAAARNAAGFASWTALYGFTRCELVKLRRKNDVLNPALAGFFTGGVLSLATMPRGYWRYGQMQILQNAGGSALIAVVFDVANRL
jgi:hypothetical protein